DEDDGMDGSGGNSASDADIVEGHYVRVYGELKFFNGKRHVSAHKIRPVTDHNEIAYHGMEAIYVHLTKTRGVAPALRSAGAAAGGGGHNATAGGSGLNAYAGAGSGGYGSMGGGGGGMGFDPVQSAVLDSIKNAPSSPEGVSIASIANSLAGRFQGHEVSKAVEWLISEGHLYNTIDDNHVSSTN
ncbi:Replication factor A protein 2, partial [Coemansia erecta]